MLEIAFIMSALALSFTNVHLVRALDAAMDYGGILDFIRLNRFKKVDPETIERAEREVANLDQTGKIQRMDAAYWYILNRNKKKLLKGIVCIHCMTIRFNLIIQFFLALGFVISGVGIGYGVVMIFMTMGLNNFFYSVKL